MRPAVRVSWWALVLVALANVVVQLAFDLLRSREAASSVALDIVSLAIPIAYCAVGGLLAARRPDNNVGWLCLLIGIVFGLTGSLGAVARWAAGHGRDTLASWAGLSDPMWALAVGLTIHLALRLPTGRLLSRSWGHVSRFGTLSTVAVFAVLVTTPGQVSGIAGTHNPLGTPSLQPFVPVYGLLAVALLGAIASLVLRYRRGDALERLQIRWIALAGMLILIVGGTLLVLTILGVVGTTGGLPPAAVVPDTLANVALPVSIGIAVTRYRLYEIDVVINRTLVYGLLTATLAATYLGLVVVLQLALRPLTRDSGLAVAASTLAVAALFRPARGRIQRSVDRRFYRSKYDAARTLEAFGVRLRDEVDLDSLSEDLRHVVAETMQPAHVSLWLRASD